MLPLSSKCAIVLACLALAGCSLFGSRGDTRYLTAEERPPLQLPDDVDRPNSATALVVPGGGSSVPVSGEGPGIAPPGIDEVVSGPSDASRLLVEDTVDNTWRRVGLAIERSGVGSIDARDEAAGTYTVTGTTTERARADVGWFGRLIGRDKPRNVTVTRVVRVAAEAGGASVVVEDADGRRSADPYSRRLIAVLRERLG
jgi:uncharacterized lipoprotein